MPQAKTPAKKGKATEVSRAIAEKLAALRNLRHESQRQFAEYMGVSFQQYQKYEKGQDRVSFEKAAILCRALGSSIEALLPWDGHTGFAETEQASYGDGNALANDEKEIVRLYRSLSKADQKNLLATLQQKGTMTSD